MQAVATWPPEARAKCNLCSELTTQHFREIFDALVAAVKELGAPLGLVKEMFNSMIGLWNIPVRTSFAARRSGCVDDMHRFDIIRSGLESDEGIADCLVRTKIVSCETAYPLALVALQKELVTVHRMHRALAGAGVDLRGVHTDGIFFRRRGADLSGILERKYPNGTRSRSSPGRSRRGRRSCTWCPAARRSACPLRRNPTLRSRR